MKTAIYHEMGWVAKVQILVEKHDDKCDEYQLLVIETIQEPGLVIPPSKGEVFIVWSAKNTAYAGWFLTDIKEENQNDAI